MSVRVAIRHLPPTTTIEAVSQQLEECGLELAPVGQTKLQRVLQGKVATKIKPEEPSTAFVELPDGRAANQLAKSLQAKQPTCRVDMAFVQKLPAKLFTVSIKIPAVDNNIQPGTWQTDPEYLNFRERAKPKQANTIIDEGAGKEGATVASKTVIVAPLVAHMRNEMLARKNKSRNAKAENNKRKVAPKSSGEEKPMPKGVKATAEKKMVSPRGAPKRQQEKRKSKVSSASSGSRQPKKAPPPPTISKSSAS